MHNQNSFALVRLLDLLTIGKENKIYEYANVFTSKNKDVESFLKKGAIQSSKLKTSATYFVVSTKNINDVCGYFTLAIKMLSIKKDSVSNKNNRVIQKFGTYNSESKVYIIPAMLVAQFGRNFNETSKSIDGSDLMNIVLNQVQYIFNLAGGKVVFIECEQNQKLIQFYENSGFSSLNNKTTSKNNRELIQFYRII